MSVLNDLRYALRTIRKAPGFAVIAVIALALGIGANTALFSLMDALLTRALPYPGSERIVGLSPYAKTYSRTGPSSISDLLEWQKQGKSFESFVGIQPGPAALGTESGTERVEGLRVSADFFRVFNVMAAIGRTFRKGEDTPGRTDLVVLSHGAWQRRFGGRPEVVGTDIVLDGRKATVIGVMAESFRFPNPIIEFWAPLAMDPAAPDRPMRVFARVKPGVVMATAQAEMDALSAQWAAAHPEDKERKVAVYSLSDYMASGPRNGIVILLAACMLVLLIACANVANLMLARSSVRAKEIAIRRALGASRGRVMVQVLSESVLIAVVGGSLGVFLASWGVDALMMVIPRPLQPIADIGINGTVLAMGMGLSVFTGLLFGLMPAWHASRTDPNDTLKEGGRSNAGSRSKGRLRAALVVAEVALCATLLVGSGVLMRALANTQSARLGFDPNSVLTMQISLPEARYAGAEQRGSFIQAALDRIRTVQGVEQAAVTGNLPLASGLPSVQLAIEGKADAAGERLFARQTANSPGFFDVMRIPMILGRGFTEADSATAPAVAVINQTMAQRYFSNENPIGRRIRLGPPEGQRPWRTIVGVVSDVKQTGIDAEVLPLAYLPFAQESSGYMFVVARTADADPAPFAKPIQQQVLSIDRALAIGQIRPMMQVISDSMMIGRTLLKFLFFLGGVALLLAVSGIYGVISYSVSQRTHEMGVRMAMGASKSDVLRMVIRQGAKLASIGLVLGAAGAVPFTKLLRSVAAGASQVDPLVVACVALLLVLVAVVGSVLPARRAASLDPMEALRYE